MMLFLLIAMYEDLASDPTQDLLSRGAAATESSAIFQSFGGVRIKVKSLKKLILMLMKSFPT